MAHIGPPQRWPSLHLREVVRHAGLIRVLIWREVKVRYKQTVIGFAWVVIQPVVTTLVFSVLFGRLLQVPSDGLPYPVFAYAALVPWTYFAHALTKATVSVVSLGGLVTKVYFPRLAIPVAAVLAGLVDVAVALGVLLVMMVAYGIAPTAAIVTLPLFLLLASATALGVGLWLAALNVAYRDVGNALPFLIQIWLFATPVAYSSHLIPEAWRTLYGLNPMAGVVEGFRWALLGTAPVPAGLLAASVLTAGTLLVSGLYFFRKQEQRFADIV